MTQPFNIRLERRDIRRARRAAAVLAEREDRRVTASEILRRGGLALVKRILVEAGIEQVAA